MNSSNLDGTPADAAAAKEGNENGWMGNENYNDDVEDDDDDSDDSFHLSGSQPGLGSEINKGHDLSASHMMSGSMGAIDQLGGRKQSPSATHNSLF